MFLWLCQWLRGIGLERGDETAKEFRLKWAAIDSSVTVMAIHTLHSSIMQICPRDLASKPGSHGTSECPHFSWLVWFGARNMAAFFFFNLFNNFFFHYIFYSIVKWFGFISCFSGQGSSVQLWNLSWHSSCSSGCPGTHFVKHASL